MAHEETATTIQSGSDSGTVVKIICRAELSIAANQDTSGNRNRSQQLPVVPEWQVKQGFCF